MNVLLGILKYPPDYAGDGLRLHRSFKRWMQKGALDRAHVLTSWDNDSSRQVTALDGIEIERSVECTCKAKLEGARGWLKKIVILFSSLRIIASYFQVFRDIDLVLTAGSGWLPSLVGWLAILTRKPLVKETVLLGIDDPESLAKNKSFRTRWFFTQPFRWADLVITISPPLEKACLSFGIPKEKIWSRFNPIEMPDLVNGEPPHPATVTGLPIILWVGTVSGRKNVEFLMRVACALKVPARILFVGPCPDSQYFKKLMDIRKEVPSYVEVLFLDLIGDPTVLAGIYAKAAIFWFASEKEGMGNVVAEALMHGTPVLTLPVMGIMKEVIPSPEAGEVVETDDPGVFAQATARWLHKKIDRKAIAERARLRFDPEKIDNSYLRYFIRIILWRAVDKSKHSKNNWPRELNLAPMGDLQPCSEQCF